MLLEISPLKIRKSRIKGLNPLIGSTIAKFDVIPSRTRECGIHALDITGLIIHENQVPSWNGRDLEEILQITTLVAAGGHEEHPLKVAATGG